MPNSLHCIPVLNLSMFDRINKFQNTTEVNCFLTYVILADIVFNISHNDLIFWITNNCWKNTSWLIFACKTVLCKTSTVIYNQRFILNHLFHRYHFYLFLLNLNFVLVLWIHNLEVYIKCFDSISINDMNTIVAFISKIQSSTSLQLLTTSRKIDNSSEAFSTSDFRLQTAIVKQIFPNLFFTKTCTNSDNNSDYIHCLCELQFKETN